VLDLLLLIYINRTMAYEPKYDYIPPFEFHPLTRIYDFVLIFAGFGKKFREKIVNSVEIKNADKVLDVGCGTGMFLKLLKEKHDGVEAIGIDPDKGALEIATKRLTKFKDVKLIRGFGETLPFEDETFDIVFSTLAFHHMPTDIKQKAIKEIFRVLKKGGKLAIVDFGTARHHRFYKIILFWEPFEYIKSNLDGVITKFMEEVGFKNVQEDSIKFPIIHLFRGEKLFIK